MKVFRKGCVATLIQTMIHEGFSRTYFLTYVHSPTARVVKNDFEVKPLVELNCVQVGRFNLLKKGRQGLE